MIKNNSIDSNLINTVDQALFSFPLLLEEKQKRELVDGIFVLLRKMENPEIDQLLECYPELLQKNDFKELLSGKIQLPNTKKQDVITAGLVSCLISLISFCEELTDDQNRIKPIAEIPENNLSLQTIQYIINSISLKHFLKHLLLIIISIVGDDYYEKFQQKIGDKSLVTEDLLKLNQDSELKEHIGLMLWYALIRLFLESVYYYFDIRNHDFRSKKKNPKNNH